MAGTPEQRFRFLELKRKRASAPLKSEAQQPQEGLGRTILEQGLQGATAGFADEITEPLGALIATAVEDPQAILTGEFKNDALAQEVAGVREGGKARRERQQEQRPITSTASQIGGAVITGIAGAGTKAGGAIASNIAKGSLAARTAKAGIAGVPITAAFRAGEAEKGKKIEAALDVQPLDFAGAVIPGAAVAGKGIARAAKETVLPVVEESLKPLARRARDLGIPLRLDQISPTRARKTVQKVSQDLPFSGSSDFEHQQLVAFNKAVARTIGEEAEDLGADTVNRFLKSANQKFSSVLSGETIKTTADDVARIAKISDEVGDALGKDLATVVRRNVTNTLSDIKAGVAISGEKLASIRSRLLKNSSSAQGESKIFISEIIDEIDNIMNKSVSAEKSELLNTARREWRNFKTIEPLLEGATEGFINPTQLQARVKASKFIKASRSEVGKDDLVDLARIGKSLLPKVGGSDTLSKGALVGAGTATAAGALDLGTTAAALGANRLGQAANTSQRLIDAALKAK